MVRCWLRCHAPARRRQGPGQAGRDAAGGCTQAGQRAVVRAASPRRMSRMPRARRRHQAHPVRRTGLVLRPPLPGKGAGNERRARTLASRRAIRRARSDMDREAVSWLLGQGETVESLPTARLPLIPGSGEKQVQPCAKRGSGGRGGTGARARPTHAPDDTAIRRNRRQYHIYIIASQTPKTSTARFHPIPRTSRQTVDREGGTAPLP